VNDEAVIQLVVQTGALGINALFILVLGTKIDRLSDRIMELFGRTVAAPKPENEEAPYGGTD
jgi:hypothetical protein